MGGPRLVVLGWDSATFDLVRPLMDEGRLPALAQLAERGGARVLRSTWPPMTDCAWTSAFTGRNPAGHGIFGSWYRAPGAYECRYFSSRDRIAPAAWELTDGARWLVWNVPMTYPPQDLDGVMVAGYGAPPGTRFCSPASFQDELAERWPLDDLLDRAPHGALEIFLDDLLRGLQAQAEALPWAIERSGADSVVAVWPHVDRAQHFFWRFRGTDHPLADAIERVYAAMDAATAAVVAAAPQADVFVISDHGAGRLAGDVDIGGWLASRGFAEYAPRTHRSVLADIAWAMPPGVRKLGRRVAPGAARRAMGAALVKQLGPFDWPRTRAFVGVNHDLWINLEGREANGCVATEDVQGLIDEIRTALGDLRDPQTGDVIFRDVYARDEIYSGAALDLAPDLMLDAWSMGYRVAVRREPGAEFVAAPGTLAGVRESWSSDHRPEGILVAAGPHIERSDPPPSHRVLDESRYAALIEHSTDERGEERDATLYDVAPTMLALLHAAIPDDTDGRVLDELIDADFLAAHPPSARSASARDARGEYSAEEAAAVAAHLQDLGYIE